MRGSINLFTCIVFDSYFTFFFNFYYYILLLTPLSRKAIFVLSFRSKSNSKMFNIEGISEKKNVFLKYFNLDLPYELQKEHRTCNNKLQPTYTWPCI